jgi:16S rRNA (cytosine1402-N4)-methyltransferase
MVHQVVALSARIPRGTFLDATIGGGGHSAALLDAHPHLDVIGIDRDEVAIAAASERLARFGARVQLRRARFDQLDAILAEIDHDRRLSGFLFDLGVSSPQLDRAERGFSFRRDGPLDMRMDRSAPRTAADVVNGYGEQQLIDLIRRNSDERFASRIAAAIVSARPLETTGELADVVISAIPAAARRTGGHPAKRTFQAIRIEVNDELRILRPALESALDALVGGGRGLVLTYHSGEDRIVKHCFRDRTTTDTPPGLPVAGPAAPFEIVRPAARRPTDDEQNRNPRAASARLRVIERRAA